MDQVVGRQQPAGTATWVPTWAMQPTTPRCAG